MSSDLDPQRAQTVAQFGDLFADSGMARIVSRVLSLLMFSGDEGRTQQEICAELGASTGHVSTSLRALMDYRMVERVPVLGERRGRYRTVHDAWQQNLIASRPRVEAMISAGQDALAREEDPGVRQRLGSMVTAAHQLRDFLDSL